MAGYGLNLGAPSALNTALAFRQAIWRKEHPDWHVCGIPAAFHVDHGPDFTSRHLEQVMADLRIRPFFSLPGKPRGRGKVERIFGTFNQMCLPHLPGYTPRGTRDRAGQARLSLAELDQAIGVFIRQVYNATPHGETGVPPQQRWESGAFIPRIPSSLEQLDLLLLTVARPRMIHPDGIHFQSLRYLDPVLAAYVGESVVIRYDPRDMAEIRIFHQDRFLCRAICPDLADRTISLKEITAARNARRRDLRARLGERASVVDRLIEGPPPGAARRPRPGAAASAAGAAPAQAVPRGVARRGPRRRRPGPRPQAEDDRERGRPARWLRSCAPGTAAVPDDQGAPALHRVRRRLQAGPLYGPVLRPAGRR